MPFTSIKSVFTAHKTFTLFVALLLVGGAGYYGYRVAFAQPPEPVRYVTEPVKRDWLVVSIPGSGQVLAEDQIDVKPEASGKIAALLVKEGEAIKAGQVIAEIDQRDALKAVRKAVQAVRDAEISLASSRFSLEKLKKPATTSSVLQAQDALNQARRDLEALVEPAEEIDLRAAEADIASAQQDVRLSADGKTPQVVRTEYDDLVPILTSASTLGQNALIDADAILGIDNQHQNLLYVRVLSALNSSYRVSVEGHYQTAKREVAAAKEKIQGLIYQNDDPSKIEESVMLAQAALASVITVLKETREALLNTPATPSFSQSSLDTLRTGIQTHLTNIETKQTSLVSQQSTIEKARDTYLTAQITLEKVLIALEKLKKGPEAREVASLQEKINEREQALADVQQGPDQLDIASAQNSVDQRVFALTSARDELAETQLNLNDYRIRSPFDGVIVKRSVRLTDTVSPSTVIVSLATKSKVAQISLNEIDISKVSLGQKATLRFDAIEGLTITGAVIQMDQAGTVSQGVVSYNVKIGFDTSDERVRSGMSVQASIITQTKANALVVANTAVKLANGQAYVQVMKNDQTGSTPENKTVEMGIANDVYTEIINGGNEGELVVTQTIQPTSAARRTPTTGGASPIRIPGVGGGGAGGFGPGGTVFRAGPGR